MQQIIINHLHDNIKNINLTNVNDIGNQLYDKFIDICKNSNSKMSITNNKIIHEINKIIRCFRNVGLIINSILYDEKIYELVSNYANQTFN